MEDEAKQSGRPDEERRREDIERLKKALREIAGRLSNANDVLKKAADKQHERRERAARAAEQLKKALDELRKRRERAAGEDGGTTAAKPHAPAAGFGGKAPAHKHVPASCDKYPDCPLPGYKGDFVSEDEYMRLTNLPSITQEEIQNTNWDLLWKFIDY